VRRRRNKKKRRRITSRTLSLILKNPSIGLVKVS